MRVLVTGASGFVGSRIVRLCRARGIETLAAIREGSSLERLEGLSDLRVLHGELADPASMRALAHQSRPNVVVHAGWSVGPRVHDAHENLDCIGGSLGLLRGLADVGCPRVVMLGTHLEYAPSDADLREGAPLGPRNLYATCKHATHLAAEAFAREAGMSLAWARLFNVYGPGEPSWPFVPTVVNHLLEGTPCALGQADAMRGFLHVDDTAAALLHIATSAETGSFDVGSSEAHSLADVARRIATAIGRPDLLQFGARASTPRDALRVVTSAARLSALGFRPAISLEAGLDTTITWWRERRADVRRSPPTAPR